MSEQELVDCVPGTAPYNCNGCSGGWPSRAMNWLETNNLVNFNDYPYTAVQGDCELSKVEGSASLVINDSDIISVGRSESGLQTALTNEGPISIVVDASNW